MKKTVLILLVILVAFQTVGFSQKKNEPKNLKADTLSADSLEHRFNNYGSGLRWMACNKTSERVLFK